MRIAIVTGNRPHTVYLCKELGKKYNVEAVFHYEDGHLLQKTDLEKSNKKRKLCERFGSEYVELHYRAFESGEVLPIELQHGYEEADAEYISSMDYGDISEDKIHVMKDINSDETISMIRAIAPDVLICHGGPHYSNDLLESAPIVLNYHSGISPLYNGTDSHMFAFANGHPHMSGGTLMLMNNKIDGGDILGHYLPSIEPGDWPGRLFTKGILGSFILYDRFLSYLSKSPTFSSVQQPSSPLFYYRRINWSLFHLHQVRLNVLNDICSKYVRDEEIIEYWSCASKTEAADLLEKRVYKLMLGHT
ncbi:formyltransferase family protein [Vibrio nigripulchritudo]|uniref:formyltransferase family protein n=1 Tax=Vibrio nigripulchritudo TaxID=28173 RepID=UPI0003B193AF|nr:formyltransferase family protein [Vibrio nigripulchritudo]CCN70629.1 hypothetical protein VIBNISFn118_2350003 [Vibrio nigripulchritudo SFn118]